MTPLLLAVITAAAPLIAIASERFGGLNPCALCLWQRWPYWAAAGFALLAYLLPRRLMFALCALAVLSSGAVAALHVGVEQKWWPSPLPECSAPTAGNARSVEDMMRALAPKPAKPCDEPAYLIEAVPVSMAAMNLIYSVALGGFILGLARRQR